MIYLARADRFQHSRLAPTSRKLRAAASAALIPKRSCRSPLAARRPLARSAILQRLSGGGGGDSNGGANSGRQGQREPNKRTPASSDESFRRPCDYCHCCARSLSPTVCAGHQRQCQCQRRRPLALLDFSPSGQLAGPPPSSWRQAGPVGGRQVSARPRRMSVGNRLASAGKQCRPQARRPAPPSASPPTMQSAHLRAPGQIIAPAKLSPSRSRSNVSPPLQGSCHEDFLSSPQTASTQLGA